VLEILRHNLIDRVADRGHSNSASLPRRLPFRAGITAVANGRIGFRGDDACGFQIEAGMTPEGQFARPAFMPIAKTPACQPRRMTDEGKAADGSFKPNLFRRICMRNAARLMLLALKDANFRAILDSQ
jgi:hypothetical protein